MAESNIGQKIWSMADTLRDDGIGKSDYLEQLTYLLFVKMAEEYSMPPYNRYIGIPDGTRKVKDENGNDVQEADCRWNTLKNKSGDELFTHYEKILKTLASQKGTLQQIYTGAQNKISNPAQLARIISMVDSENWSSMSSDVKGDIYEDLLEKIAADTKSGAGQYFTPRALINAMVKCVRPEPGKTVADPAVGSGGFLLATKAFIEREYQTKLDRNMKEFLKFQTFRGWEIVQSTYRLCLMNLFLHNISDFEGIPPITRADSLLSDPGERFDYILTNPPFGKKSSLTFTNEEGEQEQEDLVYNRQDFWATTSNKQLNFVQHIHTLLKSTGTAAVVVPDNVLFEAGAGETIRKKLLQNTDFHTILRLPTGIFYKQGVKANVIFFDNRVAAPTNQTKEVWIYDYRTGIHHTLKKKPLRESDLDDFVRCYNPENRHIRTETYSVENPDGRWRRFTYDEIIARDKTSLDIKWIKFEDSTEDYTLADLCDLIKEKAVSIINAVDSLEKLIGEVAFEQISSVEGGKTDLQSIVVSAKSKIFSLAIQGKLVSQDSKDKPASLLLEQIRAKKEALIKARRIKRDKIDSIIYRGKDGSYFENISGKTTCIDDEIPFDLPEGWLWVRLGSIAFYKKGPFGSSITKSMFIPESTNAIKVYEQKNAINKDVTLGSYYISPEKFEELKGFEVFPEEIIVSCAGTIGETYVMPIDIRKGIINQALMRISLYEKKMTDFYLLYFDFVLKSDAQDQAKGTAMKNIPPFDVLKKYFIPIPPLAEQYRIVAAIEAAFKQLDSIAANLS